MRNKNEIEELRQELLMLTNFIADYETEQEFKHKCVSFSDDVLDAQARIMEEIETEHFKSDSYLDFSKFHTIVKKIEQRIGKKKWTKELKNICI